MGEVARMESRSLSGGTLGAGWFKRPAFRREGESPEKGLGVGVLFVAGVALQALLLGYGAGRLRISRNGPVSLARLIRGAGRLLTRGLDRFGNRLFPPTALATTPGGWKIRLPIGDRNLQGPAVHFMAGGEVWRGGQRYLKNFGLARFWSRTGTGGSFTESERKILDEYHGILDKLQRGEYEEMARLKQLVEQMLDVFGTSRQRTWSYLKRCLAGLRFEGKVAGPIERTVAEIEALLIERGGVSSYAPTFKVQPSKGPRFFRGDTWSATRGGVDRQLLGPDQAGRAKRQLRKWRDEFPGDDE